MKATIVIIVAALLVPFGPPESGSPTMPKSVVYDMERVQRTLELSGKTYLEFLDEPSMSVGLYELSAGDEDPQSPHARDEIYYVLEGRAVLLAANERRQVQKGSVIYVRRGVEHRFEDITEDLSLLVVFAPGRVAD